MSHLPTLTVRGLRSFQIKFEAALAWVEDATEAEILKRFRMALPRKEQEDLLNEDAKRNQKRFWVRVKKPCPLDQEDLVVWMAQITRKEPRVEDTKTEILVEVGGEEERELVLMCNGLDIGGPTLHVSLASRKMGYEEAYKWVLGRLQVREDMDSSITTLANESIWMP